MKILLLTFLISTTCTYAANTECRIVASESFSTYFDVYVGNILARNDVGFNEAYETVSQLIIMGQCHPPKPTPKCILKATQNYSTFSDLITEKYIILNAVENNDSLIRFKKLIEIGLCEGKISVE